MSSFGPQPDGTYRSFHHHLECNRQMLVGSRDLVKCKYWARWWGPNGFRCDLHREENSRPVRYR